MRDALGVLLESGLSAVGGAVSSTVGAVTAVDKRKAPQGRYAPGSERMRTRQDRERAEKVLAKIRASMTVKAEHPVALAQNRWRAAAAKARASATESTADEESGDAKAAEEETRGSGCAETPAHAPQRAARDAEPPPRHADTHEPLARRAGDRDDDTAPAPPRPHHTDAGRHASAGGLVRRRCDQRDDDVITRAEFEAGLQRLFERLDGKERAAERDIADDCRRFGALGLLMGMQAPGGGDTNNADYGTVEISVANQRNATPRTAPRATGKFSEA